MIGVLGPARRSSTRLASLALCLAGLAAVAVLVGVVESVMARLRLGSVPQLLLLARRALAALGVLLRMR